MTSQLLGRGGLKNLGNWRPGRGMGQNPGKIGDVIFGQPQIGPEDEK